MRARGWHSRSLAGATSRAHPAPSPNGPRTATDSRSLRVHADYLSSTVRLASGSRRRTSLQPMNLVALRTPPATSQETPHDGSAIETPVRVFAGAGRRRLFQSAPQTLSGFVAALLEPGLTVATLVVAHRVFGEPFSRASMTLSLLILALTFP